MMKESILCCSCPAMIMALKRKKRNLHSSITTVRDVQNSARHIHVIKRYTMKSERDKKGTRSSKLGKRKLFESSENTIPVR